MSLASTFAQPASSTASSASTFAANAYGQSTRQIASDNDVERTLFRRATTRLIHIMAETDGEPFKATPENVAALSDNLRLWDALTLDLVNPSNSLPEELRANLVSLANFVRRHTLGLYAGNGKIDILVDINKSILAGLSAQTSTDKPATIPETAA